MSSESLPSDPSDPWGPILDAVVHGLVAAGGSADVPLTRESVLAQLSLEEGPEGEVAFPCHRSAQSLHRAPAELASGLASAFPASPLLERVSSKGAYVNFRVDPGFLAQRTLDLVLSRGNRYG
ncbi:MAG TPA: hypothetical protein VEG42_05645, partial [Thermoplasmata archaeon]|nr:hypothetical protein [Thermoplasmata archaeon]